MTGPFPAPSHTAPAPPLPALQRIALFLDIDGTLLDFAPRPDAVVVDPALPRLLQRLREHLGGALALLSGRPLDQIDALFKLRGAAAGLHGAELRHANGLIERHAGNRMRIASLLRDAQRYAKALPGVFVEDKHEAFALHWRNAPDFADAVRYIAAELAKDAGDDYELLLGHAVAEIKPRGAHKGHALDALMRDAPFAGRVPWMIGDDVTDEHAFAAALAQGGAAIRVGAPRHTQARFALATPRDVRDWLVALTDRPSQAETPR